MRRLLSLQGRALLDLYLLTGARPSQHFHLRPMDIDTTGEDWTHTLKHHKTSHNGKARVICFGPKSQRFLRLFLTPVYVPHRQVTGVHTHG